MSSYDQLPSFVTSTKGNCAAGSVRGYRQNGLSIFKGIPYATVERFMPPKPVAKWDTVMVCDHFGPQVMQGNGRREMPESVMSEKNSCVLNVWTTDTKASKPVMLWIHGGGFDSGSAAGNPGMGLAKQDVVVVSLNHRLNILGFLDLSTFGERYRHSGMVGMLDIVQALEWIRDNIAKFGGDPDQVTIGGQSGGGGKVSTTLAMPSAKGLFKRAVVQSGSTLRVGDQEYSRKLGLATLEELGVKPSQAEAKLGTFTYDELVAAGNRASRKVATAGMRGGFGPVMDGTIVADHPFDPEASEINRGIPMLIGTDFNEFTFDISEEKTEAEVKAALVERMGEEKAVKFMEEFKKAYPEEPAKAMLYMDIRFRAGALQQAAAKSRQGGANAYFYQFTWKPENNVLGASHGMELPFMFNNVALQREMTGSSESAYKLQEVISNYWLAFIKTGDPNVPGQTVWEPYNEETGPCMILDNTCVMKYNHDKALIELAQ